MLTVAIMWPTRSDLPHLENFFSLYSAEPMFIGCWARQCTRSDRDAWRHSWFSYTQWGWLWVVGRELGALSGTQVGNQPLLLRLYGTRVRFWVPVPLYIKGDDAVFSGGASGKECTCQCRVVCSIPGLGRPSRGGNGNPLLYSCLENSMDRGAWWATVHGVAKSQTQLGIHTHTPPVDSSLICEIRHWLL